MSDRELDQELEMDDIDDDDDDIMDDAAEFDIPQNAELNDDQVPEIENKFIEVVQPMWKPPDRLVIAKNCMLVYGEEKMALKHIVKNQRMVEQCLLDWGIDKFLTVMVDNASSNSLLIAYLERKTKHRKTTILNHDILHVRCSAHILNLIVCEGLQEIDVSIGRVQNIVRYVKSSPSRMAEFWSCVEKEGITCRLKPCLDVSTRWNYTYFMLERALTYQKAFDRLCDDPSFKLNVREEQIDEAFDDVDGFEVLIQQDIVKLCETDDSELHDMALGMREKFDKYWGDFDKINQMLMFAVVLDPRCKIRFIEYCFQNTLGYDKTVVGELTNNITDGVTILFEWYVKNNANSNVRSQEVGGSSDKGDLDVVEMEIGSHKSLKSQFKMHMQKETNMACKSELQKYLAEASEDDSDKFDVLRWWKLNSSKYPIVS
ncbi:hypothetical protein RHMOL_Rhmol04G0115800 [Rhododendron molle]|uniref:Uncharacterized protein n=1 Tax=Rhododendron molle TaxID=49168 RepID=A0ACC0P1S8_RHOML|nr:hypothetical protein RHMOL_Rhmol04G0115800 [Rhododendron molle]